VYVVTFFGPKIYGEIYSGNRITLNLTIFFEGKPISLDKAEVYCDFDNSSCELYSENGIYKTRGGKYGKYHFKVILPKGSLDGIENDIVLNLNYINTNSWYISKNNCIFNLYESNDTIVGDANVNVKYNDNNTENHNFNLINKDNVFNINWGL